MKKTKGFQERNKYEEYVKHEDTVLEEADWELLLLANLLEKYESNYELKTQVNKLCLNSFDEEMKYLEECIDKDESVEYLVSLDGQLEVFSSNDKVRDELLQQKESTKSLINEDNNLIGEETLMSYER